MITKEQEAWLRHLSDTSKMKIAPFDRESGRKFEEAKKEIRSALGTEARVLHRGASALGISGQAEIDVYIPVPAGDFDMTVSTLQKAFGKPYSAYPLERTKFIRAVEGTKVEVMVVNESSKSWLDNEAFYGYLTKHPEALERYRKLKEEGNGLSCQAYYRRKTEFINDIMRAI